MVNHGDFQTFNRIEKFFFYVFIFFFLGSRLLPVAVVSSFEVECDLGTRVFDTNLIQKTL